MGRSIFVLTAFVLALGAAPAYADDTPAPPPPPSATPPATGPTVIVPTAEEKRRVVEMAPTTSPAAPPSTYTTYGSASGGSGCCAPSPSSCSSCQSCNCGHQPCFLRHDACGYRLDSCGNRFGPWDVTLEGCVSLIGSPDGILGPPIFIPGHELDWDNTDYDIGYGGRVGISYRLECSSRVELRGTYYGSPSGDDRQLGFFGATPGDDGLGDISGLVDAHFDTEAELFGVELNWWHQVDCSGHWRYDIGLGLHFISFDETARVDFNVLEVGPFPVDNGFIKSKAENRYYAGQLLGAIHYDASEKVEFYASAKIMFGSIKRDIHIDDTDIFTGGSHSASSSDDEFTFGLDIEIGTVIRLSRCVGIVASYNGLFIDQVQRAEDAINLTVSNSGAVQASQNPDQLVCHSFFLGVTFNF